MQNFPKLIITVFRNTLIILHNNKVVCMDLIWSVFSCCHKINQGQIKEKYVDLEADSNKSQVVLPASNSVSTAASPDVILTRINHEKLNEKQGYHPNATENQINEIKHKERRANNIYSSLSSLCSAISNDNMSKNNFLGSFNYRTFNDIDKDKNTLPKDKYIKLQNLYSLSYDKDISSIMNQELLISKDLLKSIILLESTCSNNAMSNENSEISRNDLSKLALILNNN